MIVIRVQKVDYHSEEIFDFEKILLSIGTKRQTGKKIKPQRFLFVIGFGRVGLVGLKINGGKILQQIALQNNQKLNANF